MSVRQPQADRLLALQQRADARSRPDRPAPAAAGFRRPRRRLEPVQRLIQRAAGVVDEALLERAAVQYELHVAEITRRPVVAGRESKVQDPFDRRADYSRSSWDINHVFNFAYVYELPFGRGRKFGSRLNRGVDLLLGGWSLEGITRLETGPPILIRSAVIANTGRSSQRPNLVGDPDAGPRTR